MSQRSLPVTVVGGYLGAGKTTLLNHLLSTASGDERIAVLVNDFGEINIDAALVASHEGDTIELANGCICCSLVDGLASALETVRTMTPGPDRLVIEASGVADPATVAAYARTPGLTLDAVVVVVDSETIEARSVDRYVGDTVLGQLAAADILIVNKVDLLARADVDRVTRWLADRRPGAIIVEASHASVPAELLFGTVPEGPRADAEPATGSHATFVTWTWSSPRSVGRAAIEAAMDALPDEVWRLKGVVHLDGEVVPHSLQRVGPRWSLGPLEGAGGGGAQSARSTIVAIGPPGAIDEQWLASHLDRR